MKKTLTFKVGIQDLANYVAKSWVTCQRSLQALEEQGLIAVGRNNGRKHIVTILEGGDRETPRVHDELDTQDLNPKEDASWKRLA